MSSGFRTYHEVDELRSDLPDQIADGDERVSVRLASVARVIAVMSGKGGVGKSLVSSLLATDLADRGDRVGLVDADLNGPSVPRLLGIEPEPLAESRDGFAPPTSGAGVRVMSMAFLTEPDRALTWREPADAGFVWRGAQERGALREFLSDVAWGELDALLVDLPPGTQRLAELHALVPGLAGIVAVTIPSAASRDAVARSLDLARRRGLPILGLVENLSGVRCDACGALAPLHAGEAGAELAERFRVPLLGRIPFDAALGAAADEGRIEEWLAGGGGAVDSLRKVADVLRAAPVAR